LILGNHDPDQTKSLPWTSVSERAFASVDGQYLVLDHYAGRVWHRSHNGSVQLFGHSHGRLPDTYNSCDIGVDRWDYMPVSWPQIRARLAKIPRPATNDADVVVEEPSGPNL
jgi:calcineurin-like phosphoesterase family protein